MSHEVPHSENEDIWKAFPVLSVGKQDLLWCCCNWEDPEIETQIKALDENDLAEIADKLNDALRDDYWSYMAGILGEYLRDRNETEGE